MSVCDPGCVKTPTSNLQVESLSRLRRIRKEPLWQSPSKEEKRENNSAHSLLVHVFTQPGSISDLSAFLDEVCSTPDCVAKVPKCHVTNFSQKDKTSGNRPSM